MMHDTLFSYISWDDLETWHRREAGRAVCACRTKRANRSPSKTPECAERASSTERAGGERHIGTNLLDKKVAIAEGC